MLPITASFRVAFFGATVTTL